MSVQASADGLGGEKFPYSREYIDVVLEEESEAIRVRLGTYDTQINSNESEFEAELTANTDALFAIYGIEPANWREYVDTVERQHRDDISGKRLRVMPGNNVAAKTLHEKLYWEMPMETADDGAGEARIAVVMKSPDKEHILKLTGEGSFGQDRFYEHPVTGEKVAVDSLSDEEYREFWSHGEPKFLESEHHHRMSFVALISLAVESTVESPANT